jgi:pimeloyl-ACP methyl ester carboxylesterase
MPNHPTLLYLHGVGDGDQDDKWRRTLDATLMKIGYTDLSEVHVVAPKYSKGLHGVDDKHELPSIRVRALRGDESARHRRAYERRRTAMEQLLGPEDEAAGVPGARHAVALALDRSKLVIQAKNYTTDPQIRAYVLQRVLNQLGAPERLVITGHSLGSVIAADLLRRLPPGVQVVGMVTIGSPLAYEHFHVDRLTELLEEPPANLSWWVNLRNSGDPVVGGRGVSGVIPWVLDQRIDNRNPKVAHDADAYFSSERVATAVACGLFGSKSRALVHVPKGSDIALDLAETIALLGLRFGHLTMHELEGETGARYAEGLRQVQSQTVDQITARNVADGRPVPSVVANLTVDLSDPQSGTPEPNTPNHLSMSDAVVPLVAIATTNVLRPFEISVSKPKRQKAMEQLTLEMGLGTKVGSNVFKAVDEARDALDGPTNWVRWSAVGLGMVAVAVATGGLIFAAAPGLAGAAAITSALAAFGPGGMIGGLLTAGALVTAGGGSIAVGLAGAGTSAATVEAVVTTQLATAILRKKQGLAQDPQTWTSLSDLEIEVMKELNRLKAVSDSSAPILKELQRKLDTIKRALTYLREHGLGPTPLELTTGQE